MVWRRILLMGIVGAVVATGVLVWVFAWCRSMEPYLTP